MDKTKNTFNVNEKGYFIGTRREDRVKPLSRYLDTYGDALNAFRRGWPRGAAIYRVTGMTACRLPKPED
ncbi:MAG TPA: hypothetical protein VJH04_03030 [archaeon]|nr:hypothetical protein [archaeon]